jgi:hypothetical protein
MLVANGKAIPVTSRGSPQGCETSRLSHFIDIRLTDGGEVVSLTRRPPFTPRKIPGTHLLEAEAGIIATTEIESLVIRTQNVRTQFGPV